MFKFYFLSLKKNIYFINKQNYNKKDYLYIIFYLFYFLNFFKSFKNYNIKFIF